MRRYQQLRGLMLAHHLRARGIEVLEVERPNRRRRSSHRNRQKSDSSDAECAARVVLAGEASGVPKSGDGRVKMIRALQAARRSAVETRTQTANQLQALRVTAPEQLRNRLRGQEIAVLEAHLDRLVAQVAPELVSLPRIGTGSSGSISCLLKASRCYLVDG